jgi:DNA-binding IscR family transcriptional regulator
VLSQKTRYALKALLELAALSAGATLSSAAISARCALQGRSGEDSPPAFIG